jgi:hypothetical protein
VKTEPILASFEAALESTETRADLCGLSELHPSSFPRKRESMSKMQLQMDARVRGHDGSE